jgi:sugar lactone lactonase YvrE
MTVFTPVIDIELAIGESPLWDDRRHVLWFVDILAPAIFRLDPADGAVSRFAMPDLVASLGLCIDGRLVAALRSGVHLFDPDIGTLDFLVQPEPDRPMNRLNDGKVGPDGCFWVGSMHDALPRQPTAALYRVTPQGQADKVLDGLKVSNGLAWSPDGRIMYHADSRGPHVSAYPFDPAGGTLGPGRILATLGEADGLPDGAAVDVQGFYWSAGVTAGRLNRLAPDGRIAAVIDLPVPAPTMACFGGPALDRLYVTSLATDRTGRAVGGTVLVGDPGVTGVPVNRFG